MFSLVCFGASVSCCFFGIKQVAPRGHLEGMLAVLRGEDETEECGVQEQPDPQNQATAGRRQCTPAQNVLGTHNQTFGTVILLTPSPPNPLLLLFLPAIGTGKSRLSCQQGAHGVLTGTKMRGRVKGGGHT